MSDFDQWLLAAVGADEVEPGGWEGGWNASDPSPANPTWRGIQYVEARDFLGVTSISFSFADFRAQMTRTQISALTQANYWDKSHADLLPVGADILYMDQVFVGGGVANLQTALNNLGMASLTVDGDPGPLTLAAMQKALPVASPAPLISALYAAAKARYYRLGSFPTNGKGWLSRLGQATSLARRIAAITQ